MVRAATLIALVSSSIASAQDARPFEFRDFHVGIQLDRKDPAYLTCVNRNLNACFLKPFMVADILATRGMVTFGNGGLDSFSFDVDRSSASTLMAALVAKYGPTCSRETGDVQNGMGAKFTRESFTWCFSDGKAVFRSIGSRVTSASFTFIANTMRAPEPKVDF
jgi:hypothetical protein